MDTLRALQLTLEGRVDSVLTARAENFSTEINILLSFIRSKALLASIIQEIEVSNFDFKTYYLDQKRKHNRYLEFPSNYKDKISICYNILEAFSTGKLNCYDEMFVHVTSSDNPDDICKELAHQYVKPIKLFLLEAMHQHSNVLYLLSRYKHRTEWFHKIRLAALFEQDTKHGEYYLTADLREYLHDQGIDYPFSTPQSPSGQSVWLHC